MASCGSRFRDTLDLAENIMEDHPDSALSILKGIDESSISSKKEKARYALLMSMALDKNYVDTTNFNVLQPAIDYYLKKGTPDEKLRTCYYQGRIYQNKGELDSALNSYERGLGNMSKCKDTLCMARTLFAQGGLYRVFYDYNSYTDCQLKAARLYNAKKRKDLEFDCLINALNGTNILDDEKRADSIMTLCDKFESLNDDQKRSLKNFHLSYAISFKSKSDIKKLMEAQQDSLGYDITGYLDLAYAYNTLGENENAKQILNSVNESGIPYDTIKYQSILVLVLRDLNDYENAFKQYWDFIHQLDSINTIMFTHKGREIEGKHKIELDAERNANRNLKIIWGCIAGLTFLTAVIVILILLVRNSKAQKNLAVQKNKNIELENNNLKTEQEKLNLENRNLQLQRDKATLEAENLAHRVDTLENESECLKRLMESTDEIPLEVRNAIKIRIEMLNSLLADYISDKKRNEKPYEQWVKELTENAAEFMESNRMALTMSHPIFIAYLEQRGLTTAELNYVCLYAIGLRGTEIGSYIKKKSHVNMSTAIRKKLGITKGGTNLSIYIQDLIKRL